MPIPKDVTIISQAEESTYGPDLTPTRFIRIAFTVGKHGPYTLRIPKEEFTATKREQELTKAANEYRVP